jgi:hypothetical protein
MLEWLSKSLLHRGRWSRRALLRAGVIGARLNGMAIGFARKPGLFEVNNMRWLIRLLLLTPSHIGNRLGGPRSQVTPKSDNILRFIHYSRIAWRTPLGYTGSGVSIRPAE